MQRHGMRSVMPTVIRRLAVTMSAAGGCAKTWGCAGAPDPAIGSESLTLPEVMFTVQSEWIGLYRPQMDARHTAAITLTLTA